MTAPLKQTWRALLLWPGAGQWKAAAAVALPAILPIALAGFLGGWLRFEPVTDIGPALAMVIALFFVPALAEELLFRGVLLTWLASFSQRWGNWMGAVLYTLWHPAQALTFGPPWPAMFLQPSFLFATFILAIILTHIRIVSRSLWPVIVIHWALVALWKLFFGGPFYGAGTSHG